MSAYPAIAELVPHQVPMLALDELIHYEPGQARARLVLRPGNPMARGGVVDSVATLEHMAQAVAACLGMEAYAEGEAVRVGMVIACRKMEVFRPALALGEEFQVEARRVRGTESLSHFEAEVRDLAGVLVATSTLTLVHGMQPPS
ncbi:MAG: hypothetical protein KDE27_07830 [Planctomycetes bacterium]|nr:hypothetical protein [Planctomycetota bacterium]